MIHIAIVEDEAVYSNQLSEYITKFQKETSIDIQLSFFQDGDEIVEGYKADYDIILMDIQMQFMDGMTAARRIRELDTSVIIIFITNMTSYAVCGYEVDAMDYIVKPIEYFSFSHKLKRAIDRMEKKEKHFILVNGEGGTRRMNLSDIYYVESYGHQLIFVTSQGQLSSRGVMKELEEELAGHNFYRIMKSYLVNMRYVDGIEDGCCLVHGDKLTISRQKRKEFMEALTDCIS